MIYVITGPTCLGKSETAIFLANKIGAEIVNGDAFQCYKEMSIGVAKPSEEDLKKATHHLYSFIDVSHEYSIAEYQLNLRKKIDEIQGRGKDIILVGGSGLYIRSALYDYEFNEQKEVDMSNYEKMDDKTLHLELEKIDPVEATKIHENNRKRVLRAIEIFLSEGKTKSELISEQEHKLIYESKFFVRDMDRDDLYNRINKRVDIMIEQGLVNEVKNIVQKYGKTCRSLQAIGYKEIIEHLDGKITLEEAIELIKKNTRNYAKRQMTFIRHQFPVVFYKNNEDILKEIKNG